MAQPYWPAAGRLVRNTLEEDPLSGQLSVFINCRRNQCKVLYFEPGGYCICKRLEQGQFHAHTDHAARQLLALADLKMIIDGIDARSVCYRKRYVKPDYKPAENRNNVFSQILLNYLCLRLNPLFCNCSTSCRRCCRNKHL